MKRRLREIRIEPATASVAVRAIRFIVMVIIALAFLRPRVAKLRRPRRDVLLEPAFGTSTQASTAHRHDRKLIQFAGNVNYNR